MTDTSSHVRLEVDGLVAVITIDRPEKHNSMTLDMLQRVAQLADEAQDDDGVRVIVLTGAGDKAFSAGGDLTSLLPGLAESGDDSQLSPDPSKRFFSNVTKPIVAAVRGICVAGGLEILLGTDLRVASTDARFGLAEVRWGVIPAAGSLVRLPRQVPWAVAMQMILTGQPIDARRAFDAGLVNEVVPSEEVLPTAMELARRIAANGPVAVRTAKEIAVASLQLEAAFRLESALNARVLHSQDIREGLSAFAEGRRPNFSGK